MTMREDAESKPIGWQGPKSPSYPSYQKRQGPKSAAEEESDTPGQKEDMEVYGCKGGRGLGGISVPQIQLMRKGFFGLLLSPIIIDQEAQYPPISRHNVQSKRTKPTCFLVNFYF